MKAFYSLAKKAAIIATKIGTLEQIAEHMGKWFRRHLTGCQKDSQQGEG
jgi:hypothetical protein